MAWYTFHQNNSGGSFEFNKKLGITHYVIIEADTAGEANFRAEDIGLYWEGVDRDMDCPCCGDRWNPAREYDRTEQPEVYGEHVGKIIFDMGKWMEDGREIAVHPKYGKIRWYG